MKKTIISGLKNTVGAIPIVGDVARSLYRKIYRGQVLTFETSSQYWDDRYRLGGNSGSGSYGRLARFKAEFLNDFVEKNGIEHVVEFGCGDGAQLELANYKSYIGFDVSQNSVDLCRVKFPENDQFSFFLVGSDNFERLVPAKLTLSLDVIYHLIEDDVFESYMSKLFSSSECFVIIYAYDFDKVYKSKHEKGRNFTLWIKEKAPDWTLSDRVPNKYPYDPSDPNNTSQSDFYVFRKVK